MGNNEIEKSLENTLFHDNERLEGHDKLDRIIVNKEPLSIENDPLTPTPKLNA